MSSTESPTESPNESIDTLVQFFKTLSDASRLRIIGLLAHGERSVDELAELLSLKAPTVSHHLKRLKALSLVTMRSDGNNHFYTLDENALHYMSKEILKTEAITRTADDLVGDSYTKKVLNTFIIDGRLTAMPMQRKKRDVILRYLVERFEVGRAYPEREVNDIIRTLYDDTATLRRELVDIGLMTRSSGIYHRIEGA